MKLLLSLLPLSGLSSLLRNLGAHAIESKAPSGSNGQKFANLQPARWKKRGKKRRGKYAMPENYDSTPPLRRIPTKHIHPAHMRLHWAAIRNENLAFK